MTTIKTSIDGEWYIATFFENAVEEDVKTNEESGWKITTGFLDGEAVPIRAYYRTDKYSLDYVKKKAENLRECPICKRLGQDMSVTSIEVENNYERRAQPEPASQGVGLNRRAQPSSPMSGSDDLMGMMFGALLDTTLTPLGKIMAAKMTDNDALLENALPKSEEDQFNLVSDFLSSDTPKDMIFKKPEEMKEYAEALRARTLSPEEAKKAKEPPVYRRPRTMIIS